MADNTEDIQLGLHCAYKNYKAYLKASHTYDLMVADGTWEGHKLSKVDLIQLFMSQSFYYSHYQKYFTKVPNYLILMEWLENDPEDHPDDKDVWGVDMVKKSNYNFSDLEKFFKMQEKKKGKKAEQNVREGGSKEVKDKKKKKKQIK